MRLGGALRRRLCNPLETKARAQQEQNGQALGAPPVTDEALALQLSVLSVLILLPVGLLEAST